MAIGYIEAWRLTELGTGACQFRRVVLGRTSASSTLRRLMIMVLGGCCGAPSGTMAVAALIEGSAKHSPFPVGRFRIVKVLAAAWRTRAGTLGTRSSPAGVVAVVGWTTRKRRCPVRPRRLQLAHPGLSLLDGSTITEGLLTQNGLTIAVGYLMPNSSLFTKGYSLLNGSSGPRALRASIRKTAAARLPGFTTRAASVSACAM